jgi:hypothetical protein
VERQQLKWIASAAALVALVFPLQLLPTPIGGNPKIGEGLVIIAVLLVPVAAGIAILRYRLYDIDIVINRTLVYGPLSAILAGVYIASIGFFQRIFASITGDWSEPTVVLTTLIVVALFTPIRNRLQTVVDKRFKTSPRDPLHDVREMARHVRSVVDALDRDRVARRFLEQAVGALEAEGGALYLRRNGSMEAVHTHEDWKGDAALTIDIIYNGVGVGRLALGQKREGREYRPEEARALEECAGLMAGALASDRLRGSGSLL